MFLQFLNGQPHLILNLSMHFTSHFMNFSTEQSDLQHNANVSKITTWFLSQSLRSPLLLSFIVMNQLRVRPFNKSNVG